MDDVHLAQDEKRFATFYNQKAGCACVPHWRTGGIRTTPTQQSAPLEARRLDPESRGSCKKKKALFVNAI